MADPRNMLHPTCYHTKFCRSRLNRLGVGMGLKNFRDAGPMDRDMADPRNTLLPYLCYIKFSHSTIGQTIECYYRDPPANFELCVLPFKVTGTNTGQSPTCDFLLVIHSNIPFLRCDNCKILPPHIFNTPAEGLPLEFCNGAGTQKTRMMPLSSKSVSLCPNVFTQFVAKAAK